MIVYPEYWRDVGRPVEIKEIEERILEVLRTNSCNCLALSGGLDSRLLLYFMLEIYATVNVFTSGSSDDHPDIRYAKEIVGDFEKEMSRQPPFPLPLVCLIKHRIYIPKKEEIEAEESYDSDVDGDKATRLFYRFVRKYTDRIISGDGADEFMAGYYDHQNHPNEETYYGHIRQLQKRQLVPLNGNSGNVRVYLPYLDKSLLYLLSQIPLAEKVNENERKMLMAEMAKGKILDSIINRRKIGFCDVLRSDF